MNQAPETQKSPEGSETNEPKQNSDVKQSPAKAIPPSLRNSELNDYVSAKVI